MPDPFGILIGLASLAVAVLLLRYGDQFSDGNIERDEARATRPQEAPDAGMKDLAERTQSAWEDGRKAGVIEAMNAAQTQRDRLAAKLADAEAKVAGLREALDMAKRHMIVNDLSLPNVFEVIDAAPAAAEGAKG